MRTEYLFYAFVAFFLVNLAWRYFRSGSFSGAMLGGRIKREVGQVALADDAGSTHDVKVHVIEPPDGETFVGIVLVSKAPLSASMVPIRFSRAQAQELARLLQQAAEG